MKHHLESGWRTSVVTRSTTAVRGLTSYTGSTMIALSCSVMLRVYLPGIVILLCDTPRIGQLSWRLSEQNSELFEAWSTTRVKNPVKAFLTTDNNSPGHFFRPALQRNVARLKECGMLGCPHLLVEVGPVPDEAEEQDNHSKLARRHCAREGDD